VPRHRTLLLFGFVTLVFGTAFPAIKAGLSHFPPLLFVAARNYLAAALLLGYVGATATDRVPRTRRDWLAVLAGGAFLVGGTGFGFVGQQYIASGVAAVIFSLSPILTGLLAWPLLPAERLSGRDVVGVLVGFLGVAIVLRPDPGALLDPELVGKVLVFTGVSLVALGAVLVRRSQSRLPVPALTAWAMVVGATIQLAAAFGAGESLGAVRVTPTSVATLLYLAAVVGAVGFVSYLSLMDAVGPLKANLTSYLTPVVALAVGRLWLGEQVGATTLLGFLVVVVGFALLERRALAAELARYRTLVR
jgi:drug/metabolite transporter (DMT)-like permease